MSNARRVRGKTRIVDLLFAVAVIAVALAASVSYFRFRERQWLAKERTLEIRVGSIDSLTPPARAFYDERKSRAANIQIIGTIHSFMFGCAVGLLSTQLLRRRRGLRYIVRQPGTAGGALLHNRFLCGSYLVVVDTIDATVSSGGAEVHLLSFALIDRLDEKVGTATLVLWLALLMGRCMRFERSFLEVVGICLGICWIIELIGSPIALALL